MQLRYHAAVARLIALPGKPSRLRGSAAKRSSRRVAEARGTIVKAEQRIALADANRADSRAAS